MTTRSENRSRTATDIVVARDVRFGHEVVIKRAREVGDAAASQLLNDGRIQARLAHPAILTVHDFHYDTEGRARLVMVIDDRDEHELRVASRTTTRKPSCINL